jgi:hypothetical protein
MELVQKFKESVATQTVRINTLDINRKYEIVRAERVTTIDGLSVLLYFKDYDPCNTVKAFMSKRYTNMFTDEDVHAINTRSFTLHLVYNDLCIKSNSYILRLEV